MNTIQKRFILFLIGCIGTRSLLVYVAKTINPNFLPYMGILAFCIAAGFLYFYFSGTRTRGIEVFNGKIWWNDLRIVHAALYMIFGVYALQKKTLFLDASSS